MGDIIDGGVGVVVNNDEDKCRSVNRNVCMYRETLKHVDQSLFVHTKERKSSKVNISAIQVTISDKCVDKGETVVSVGVFRVNVEDEGREEEEDAAVVVVNGRTFDSDVQTFSFREVIRYRGKTGGKLL